jgi:hypothetical protein
VPLEPGFVENVMDPVSDILAASLLEDGGSCAGGMDAEPASDPCERALKQTTALLFNLASSRLSGSCMADLSDRGCESHDLTSLVDELAALINSGDVDNCRTASSCAMAVNAGAVALESAVVIPGQTAAQHEPTSEVPRASARGHNSGGVAQAARTADGDASRPTVDAGTSVLVVPLPESHQAEAEEAAEESPLKEDERRILRRHLAVVANSAAPDAALDASMAALLTALGGGYEPEVRLEIVRRVLDRIDVAYYGLLARHLEDIRIEAQDLGLEDLDRQAAGLLESLEGGE